VVQEQEKSYFTPFICTAISIERHKVSQELIACFAGADAFEIVVIALGESFGKTLSRQYL